VKKEKEVFQSLYEQGQLNNYYLPTEIQKLYQIISFLKCSEERETLLLLHRLSGEKCILKIASGKSKERLLSEEKILKKLIEKGVPFIPRPIMALEESGKLYFLREYIEGYTCRDVVEKSGGYSEQELIELGMKLCDNVSLLHAMDEPIIHRDIKPENIIITRGGSVNLIDFETVRFFSDEKEHDTVYLGTATTAAPEQYGYSQTDVRTDIYALGMTMLYLSTVSYNRDELMNTDYSSKTKKVILKCCSFDPAGRYQSAADLKKALNSATVAKRRKKSIWSIIGTIVFLLVLIFTFYLGTLYKQIATEAAWEKAVVFNNTLLEQEIRLELGIDKNTPVTYQDLENVHRIALIGTKTMEPSAEFAYRDETYVNEVSMKEVGGGNISDISLLAYMPNLYELILCQQEISDIKPLKGLHITKLVLADNKITDLSPLAEMPNLEELYIGNNPAEDLSPLERCTSLYLLNIDGMTVKNIDFLNKLSLNSLSVCLVKLIEGTWNPVASQKGLQRYATAGLTSSQAAAVNQLSDLYEFASWWDSKLTDLTKLNGLKNLHTLIISDGFHSLDGIEAMQHINDLFIGYSSAHDIPQIERLPELETLGLDHTNIEDFSVLFKCPSLKKVMQVRFDQKQEILKINPEPSFEITVQ
jgi:serine/threonine protein kinase